MASYSLCTVDDVRAYLQKQVADTAQDDVIETLIDAASRAIIERFGKFAPTEDGEDKEFTFFGGYRLDLFPFYIRSVDSIVTSLDGTDTTLDSTDWDLRPKNNLDGVFRWIRLPTQTTDSRGELTVTVTGDWGFEEIPASVVQAAVITVVEWIRKDVAAFSTTYSIDQDRLDVPEAIPRAAMRLLLPYAHERQG